MTESTQPQPTETSPAVPGWCSWHRGQSSAVRLINVHEQGSGPGGGVYACAPCQAAHHLVPFADRPL